MDIPTSCDNLTQLIDHAASTQAGLTIYANGENSKPTQLSYNELRTLVNRKAESLRAHGSIKPGKVVLIHFKSHLENIVWFWAVTITKGIPALSTPLVSNREGRVSHFRHLHRLLLDPTVLTTEDLQKTDFLENPVLRLVAVEEIDGSASLKWGASSNGTGTFDSDNGISPHHANSTNSHHEPILNGASNGVTSITTNGVNGYSSSDQKVQTNGHVESLEGVAVLMLTSGSTGNAKAVCLTHRQIFAAIQGKSSIMPLPEGSSLFNWIALDHVASLVEIHLCAMASGLDQVHISAAEMIANPLAFLHMLSKHRVSRTFAPNFFLQKLQKGLSSASAQTKQSINLSNLHYIASGGEPNSVDTCAQLAEQLVTLGVARRNVITPGFGMTETCAGAIFNLQCPDIDMKTQNEFASLGKCTTGISMRVSPASNGSDTEADHGLDNLEGALEIKGPIVFERYFNDQEATRNAFTPDGWFKTGDLASIADGNLRLVGRSKELININGVKYLPYEIEGAIEQEKIPGVKPSCLVCFEFRPDAAATEQIYVVYERMYDENDQQARAETLNLIVRTVVLFAGARPRVLPLRPGSMDKTTLGKISRAKIRNLLVQGQFRDEADFDAREMEAYREANFSRPQDTTQEALLTILLDTLGLDSADVGIDTPVLDIGVSSVDLIRMKSAAEKTFGISDIPIITIMNNNTIRSLASAIEQLQESQKYKHRYNPAIALQSNGSKTPLWLIHPGIGEILVFLGLVKYFPDRPIFALRTRGFNPGESPFTGLHEVLATYYHAIKSQQPVGPYAIAGYSYGSMLAFELSKIIEGNGDEVRFLGSFNLPPHIKERMRTLDWTAGVLHIAHFCGIISERRSEELVPELKGLSKEDRVSRLLAESDRQRCAELALTHESLLNWTDVAWSLQKIGWEYDPSGAVASMDVFYCQPLKVVASTREEYRNTKLNHWVDFVRGGDVRFHEVDGEHYTMIGPDHVGKFQQTLKKALAARGL